MFNKPSQMLCHCEEPKATRQSTFRMPQDGLPRFARNDGAWRLFFALIVTAICVATAQAQVTPVIFERENITITSGPHKSAHPETTLWAGHQPLTYNTEVRPEDALRLEYIHTLNELTDSTGVMIAFTAPSVVPLPALKVPTAVDAVFIMDNGTISQILPNVVLADLTQDIVAREPIKAFLFLKAGEVKARGIQPRDIITAKQFTPAPPMLQ